MDLWSWIGVAVVVLLIILLFVIRARNNKK
jgi:hypothetical protein